MEHGPVARIRFRTLENGLSTCELSKITAQAQLPTDPADAPFGMWTLCAELWYPPDETGTTFAWVQFLSPEAPSDFLKVGERFVLYSGSRPVADVQIVVAKNETAGLMDTDFLLDRQTPPRQVL